MEVTIYYSICNYLIIWFIVDDESINVLWTLEFSQFLDSYLNEIKMIYSSAIRDWCFIMELMWLESLYAILYGMLTFVAMMVKAVYIYRRCCFLYGICICGSIIYIRRRCCFYTAYVYVVLLFIYAVVVVFYTAYVYVVLLFIYAVVVVFIRHIYIYMVLLFIYVVVVVFIRHVYIWSYYLYTSLLLIYMALMYVGSKLL